MGNTVLTPGLGFKKKYHIHELALLSWGRVCVDTVPHPTIFIPNDSVLFSLLQKLKIISRVFVMFLVKMPLF